MAGFPLLFLLGFIVSTCVLAATFYLEHGVGLAPCALCLLQRCCIALFALVCLGALIHKPGRTGRRVYGFLGLVLTGLGAFSAGRQVWLQSLPAEQKAGCSLALEQLLHQMPLREVIPAVFNGSADCLELNWSFLGMSVPEWSLLAFAGFMLLCCFQVLRRH